MCALKRFVLPSVDGRHAAANFDMLYEGGQTAVFPPIKYGTLQLPAFKIQVPFGQSLGRLYPRVQVPASVPLVGLPSVPSENEVKRNAALLQRSSGKFLFPIGVQASSFLSDVHSPVQPQKIQKMYDELLVSIVLVTN